MQGHDGAAAVVVNCWHDSNKGDAAITIGVLNALKTNGAASRFFLVSYVFHADEASARFGFRHVLEEHPGSEIIQPSVPALIRSVGRRRGVLLAFRAALKLLLPAIIRDDPMEAAIRQSSIVVSNGG